MLGRLADYCSSETFSKGLLMCFFRFASYMDLIASYMAFASYMDLIWRFASYTDLIASYMVTASYINLIFCADIKSI